MADGFEIVSANPLNPGVFRQQQSGLSHYSQLLTITHQTQEFIPMPSVIQPLNPDTGQYKRF